MHYVQGRDELIHPEAVAYLQAAGWRYLGPSERPSPSRCWEDPRAGQGRAEIVQANRRLDRTGRAKTTPQIKVPGAVWACSTVEALRTQEQREEAER